MMKTRSLTSALALLAIAAAVVFSSALRRAPLVEQSAPPSPAAAEQLRPPVVNPDFSPPRAGEAVSALYRAFGNTVEMERDAATVGDFNGDGSPDLAVDVRAAEAHAPEINDPLANWTVQDCDASTDRRVAKAPPPSPPRVRSRELLLAVVHGYGRRGWRDPGAQQAYLVKGALEGPWVRRSRDRYPGLDAPERQTGDILAGSGPASTIAYWTGARYVCRNAEAARLRVAARP